MNLVKKALLNIKTSIPRMHFGLLILMIGFAFFGLVMILSASNVAAVVRYGVSPNYFSGKQLLVVVGSFLLGFFLLNIPIKKYDKLSGFAIILMIIVLVLLFTFGTIAGGALSWFDLGYFNFQPTEFIKPIIIIYMASYYFNLINKKKYSLFDVLIPLLLCAVIVFLVLKQPDLGGAAIILLMVLSIFFAIPINKNFRKKIFYAFGIGILVVGLFVLIFGKTLLQSYQVNRLINYANPCQRYTEDSGYQVCNGYIAIHNGGLFGVGLGQSSQKYLYLPEAHTDFIYPIIVEECGLLVGILIVFLYFIMLVIILDIAKKTYNLRNSILVYGVFVYLLAHILINMLGVLGIIPLTGVPLPFLSYGGSYNFSVIVMLFLVQRVNIENRLERERKKIENL